ncbi:hypothetical protein [Salinibacter ruber]|uniref:Uncharacterized protein n=1 Tax=Salinibacter ruber TaxID=146919 RepID=A0AAW5PD14_9BACT|nr:hypothetical protein [Salinibacter ruber]MCS4159488.1 hypothetical protein [Salinibacter ruber]
MSWQDYYEDMSPRPEASSREEMKHAVANSLHDTIVKEVDGLLSEGTDLREKLDEIKRLLGRDFLRQRQVEDIASCLRMVSGRTEELADDLESCTSERKISLS